MQVLLEELRVQQTTSVTNMSIDTPVRFSELFPTPPTTQGTTSCSFDFSQINVDQTTFTFGDLMPPNRSQQEQLLCLVVPASLFLGSDETCCFHSHWLEFNTLMNKPNVAVLAFQLHPTSLTPSSRNVVACGSLSSLLVTFSYSADLLDRPDFRLDRNVRHEAKTFSENGTRQIRRSVAVVTLRRWRGLEDCVVHDFSGEGLLRRITSQPLLLVASPAVSNIVN